MQFETSRFGSIEIDQNATITLTQPIIGFQEYRRFVILPGPSDFLLWLQSTDSGDLAFILMDPRTLIPDYKVTLSQHDLTELAAASVDELDVYTLVVVPRDRSKVRTNMKAPLLINAKHRLGKQVVLDTDDYPVQYFLAQPPQSATHKEVSNARTHA